MKVRGERGRLALYIGCVRVYMPTDSTSVTVLDTSFEWLKDDDKQYYLSLFPETKYVFRHSLTF